MTQAVTATRAAQRAATAAKETRKGDEETAVTKAVASRNAEWKSHATQDKPTAVVGYIAIPRLLDCLSCSCLPPLPCALCLACNFIATGEWHFSRVP